MAKRNKFLHPDAPLLLTNHRRPRTRREFIAQSFTAGSGLVIASSLAGLLPNAAHAEVTLSNDIQGLVTGCAPTGGGGQMIPFICFDLAGGANIAGSNVLIGAKTGAAGGNGAQLNLISTAGYGLLGLPTSMVPAPGGATTFIDQSLGLAFHSDSAFLRGIKTTLSTTAMANINGAVIPARSENDTGNNPHNPMYAIYRAGSRGDLVNLIGSQNSDSGGNSMAPAMLIDISTRPTQVTRPSDVVAMVGSSSDVPSVLSQPDTVAAMESVTRISGAAIDQGIGAHYLGSGNTSERSGAKCEILKSAVSTAKFGDGNSTDPSQDPLITSIFDKAGVGGVSSDGEFLKTASIMKMVVGGAGSWPGKRYASAGTITMGGFDYHTGDRTTGEARDFRAGKCMGACLEYAHLTGTPLMLYVFSDGSLSSNGGVDPMVGKNNWDSDNQSTGAAFFLVYNPVGRPQLTTPTSNQIGWMRMDGSVDTAGSPAANSVTQLVDMAVLNYLALHNNGKSLLSQALGNKPEASILGGTANWGRYTAFQPII